MLRTLKLSLTILALLSLSLSPAAEHPARAQAPADDFERGRQLLEQGDAEGATALLQRAAERRKTDADAWYAYGLALARFGKGKDARKAFERAVKLRPDWATARASLAYTLILLDRVRDAEREAGRALALDPKSADAHFVMGHVRYGADDFRGAAAEAEAALQASPNFAAAAFLYGDALLNLYVDESVRQSQKYSLTPAAGDAERKLVFERRDATLKPLRARMHETAERLDAFAKERADADEARSLRELADSLRVYGKAGGESPGVFRNGEVTKKAVILFKPEPAFTEEARQRGVSGRVRLRAVLGADGQVRNIMVIKRLPAGLTEKCVEMARRIRFTPAAVGDTPVSQWVVLEYEFNIY